MATKRKKKTKPRSKFRASWRGQLRFGLVSFEVQAINAQNKSNAEIHFHLLHAPDHERIHYAKICPKHGEVPSDEIVEGFEVAKGKYVEFEKEELDQLRSEQEKALTIDAFVSAAEIDPIYFDGRMYYLIPSGSNANEPYTLLESAMDKKERWAVGQVVFSGREQLVVVRPLEGVLVMAMLNYDAEMRKPAELKAEFTRARTTPSKLKLAEQLIGKWHDGKFDFSQYADNYREKIQAAIAAKKKGETFEPEPEEEPEVINLMEALKRSVANAGGRARARKKAAPKRARRKTAAKRRA